MSGPLALVGGGEWQGGWTFDAELLGGGGGNGGVRVPPPAADGPPDRAVATAERWFRGLGADVRGLMVLRRAEAEEPEPVAAVRAARYLYLAGGSPMHLRSVLKDSPLWD